MDNSVYPRVSKVLARIEEPASRAPRADGAGIRKTNSLFGLQDSLL